MLLIDREFIVPRTLRQGYCLRRCDSPEGILIVNETFVADGTKTWLMCEICLTT